jgi:dihydrofolate reductase
LLPVIAREVSVGRRLRYQVAASLDGFIADPNGGYDWIVSDTSIDFAALYKEFDAAVMGRKTYELVESEDGGDALPEMEVVAFSRTRTPAVHRGVRLTNEDPVKVVRALKAKKGRDIWLFGGGALFRILLDAQLVDTVEVAVMPVLLGEGIPLLPPGGAAKLKLADHRILPRSGIVLLAYTVGGSRGAAPRIHYVKSARGARKKRASKGR